MRRRDFITLLGGAAVAWPMAAQGQQAGMPVVGVLNSGSQDQYTDRVRAFRQGLSDTGYVDGRNVVIEYRWAEDQNDRLLALAADLVRRQVTVIAAIGGGVSAVAAKAATKTIPIVFQTGADPVQSGLVNSLNHPGGNLTGVTSLNAELVPKRVELLREMIPTATNIALLAHPINVQSQSRVAEAAARRLGLQLHVLRASSESEFETIFATLVRSQVGGLVIGSNPLFNTRTEQIAALALRYSIPTVFQYREFAAGGGLMSYGGSFTDSYRQVGLYTGRILNGDRPADLPVQQYTKVELIINLKTAKALGITFPLSLLGRADEVIE